MTMIVLNSDMTEFNIRNGTTTRSQIRFLQQYEEFPKRAVYGFLFENLNLRQIESKYLNIEGEGFFAKSVLNSLGVDTSNKNRGSMSTCDLKSVTNSFITDTDPRKVVLSNLLNEIWMDSIDYRSTN